MTRNSSRESPRDSTSYDAESRDDLDSHDDPDSHDDRPRSPTLSAVPEDAPADRPLEIALTGVPPDRRVTVTAAFSDFDSRWQCEATFETDDAGVVDLTEQAPIAGDYDGVRPMGLVQFATEVEDAASDGPASEDPAADATTTDSTTDDEDPDAYELHLTAAVDGDPVAETAVTRRVRAPGVERVALDPDRDGVAGLLFVPPGDGPHPGVVALHGSGGDPEVRMAKALASRGYATLALRYFGEPEPIPDQLVEVPVSYVGRAIDRLRECDGVRDGAVGVLGTSRGTELAFLTAAARDDVGAVVAYAPSAYVWPGEEREGEQSDDDPDASEPADERPAAWTLDGDPLRPVPRPDDEEPTPATTERGIRPRPVFETCVAEASPAERERAALPVEDVAADVVLVSGGDDGVWHADEMAETLAERLRTEAPTSDVAHVSHEDAGHHAAPPFVPTPWRTAVATDDGPDLLAGGTPEGIAELEARAWEAVLDAFGDALGDD